MSGNSIVLDTNIIFYLLNGNKEISTILDGLEIYVSVISEIELLGYHGLTDKDKIEIKKFLSDCTIISLNNEIKEISIAAKQISKAKTPDAIVAATAIYLNLPLITADIGFNKIIDLNLILFQL
jgi:predicted nucleic acid-binding protein